MCTYVNTCIVSTVDAQWCGNNSRANIILFSLRSSVDPIQVRIKFEGEKISRKYGKYNFNRQFTVPDSSLQYNNVRIGFYIYWKVNYYCLLKI